jgi:SsrA-binding protein
VLFGVPTPEPVELFTGCEPPVTKDAFTHSAKRDRKLLLKKKELNKLSDSLVKGLTILPYKIFMNDRGIVKLEIVLGRGKKLYDKRETIKERDINRELKKEY